MATERQVYGQGIIEKQSAIELTTAEFFKLNNINPATYYYWFKKINTQEKPKCNRILPVVLATQSPVSSHQTVELLLPNGYQLSFEASIEPTDLKQILAALSI
ncbi:MAG: hypothetical protein ACI9IJ_000167 [Psychromonas sp.]|jgi:hypothetical protein